MLSAGAGCQIKSEEIENKVKYFKATLLFTILLLILRSGVKLKEIAVNESEREKVVKAYNSVVQGLLDALDDRYLASQPDQPHLQWMDFLQFTSWPRKQCDGNY
jgi:hypothetical protein